MATTLLKSRLFFAIAGSGGYAVSPASSTGTEWATYLERTGARSLCNLLTTNILDVVEAGGVEPPSEKRYEPKTTCLSQFGERPGPCGLIARSPAALGMSKMRNQLVR
jgi:hypothetical protein